MLKGRASRDGYALFLSNLQPAYRFLEAGLERHRGDPRLAGLAMPELYRSQALAQDLVALAAEGARLPARLPAGLSYGARVAAAHPPQLIAHAYVRYLGDLSGGRILGRLLARSPGIGPAALSFYDFPGIADPERYRDGYRAAIDAVSLAPREIDKVLDEACAAFEHNVRLSLQVASLLHGGSTGGRVGT